MKIFSSFFYLIAIFFMICFPSAKADVYIRDNGIIKIIINEHDYPMVTSLFVDGKEIIPHDNVGADFQMTGRSIKGNSYNPTQGGDCTGTPSNLYGVINHWTAGLPISKNNGILLGIKPLNYNEPTYGKCIGSNNKELPYNFQFGIVLGDGINFPKNGAVIDMKIHSWPNSPVLLTSASELPVAFPKTSVVPYAYYSYDGNKFFPLRPKIGKQVLSHNTKLWPLVKNIEIDGRVILLSNIPDAHKNITSGTGIAFYSHKVTRMCVSHRYTHHDLTLLSTYGSNDINEKIEPNSYYKIRRIMAVGSVHNIQKIIKIAEFKKIWEQI